MTTRRFVALFAGVMLLAVSIGAAADLRLIEAVKTGDAAAVQALVKQKIDVNVAQGDGSTALHWAAYRDDGDSADLLIRAGANANQANDIGVTPLLLAATNGSPTMVARLLKAGANANAALESGETPLMAAARAGNAEAVRQLLIARAAVNAKENWRGQTALMWAVAQKRPGVVQALIEAGADIHARTKSWYELVNPTGSEDGSGVEWVEQGGFTALLFAAREGDLQSARLLLEKGANVNDSAANGASALVIAAHSNNPALAAFLLDKGADPNAAAAGYGALHLAILHADLTLVRQLLARGANPNLPLERATAGRRSSAELQLRPAVRGATPFWIAARFGEPHVMQALIDAGADPLFVKTTGVPAIVQASEVNGRPLPEPAGMTALMAALAPENIRRRLLTPTANAEEPVVLEAVKIAIARGIDVNAVDDDGDSAMHRAVRLRFNSVVQFLAENGARLDVRNKEGQTPLMIASMAPSGGRGGGGGAAIAGRGGSPEPTLSMVDLLRKLGARE